MNTIPQHISELLRQKVIHIYRLPLVCKVILYGSYAKGEATDKSDVDVAVFFDTDKQFFLEEYRQLVKICNNAHIDFQVQAFSNREL
ncbi:MAG: nucleotidyltransferase domain-containing protein, partial [Clostridiales bacterium]